MGINNHSFCREAQSRLVLTVHGKGIILAKLWIMKRITIDLAMFHFLKIYKNNTKDTYVR